MLGYILGRPHGHGKVNSLKGIGRLGPQGNVCNGRGADLSGKRIPVVGTGRGGSVMAFLPFHLHGPVSVSVKNGPALGGGCQAFIYYKSGDLDSVALYPCPGLFHEFMNSLVLTFKAYLFNDIKGSLANLPYLVVGENFHSG